MLEFHRTVPLLSLLAVKAVANLTANHPNNIAKLGNYGAIETIVGCVRLFSLPTDLKSSVVLFTPSEEGLSYLKFSLWALGNLVQQQSIGDRTESGKQLSSSEALCDFHVLSDLLLIYICKLHWNPHQRFLLLSS